MSESKQAMPSFGNGRYSQFAGQVWTGCTSLFGMPSNVAEKIARDAASDYGAAMSKAVATASIGKVGKNGTATIKDVSTLKAVYMTNPLSIARAIQWIDEAGKNGVSYGNTSWELTPVLKTYVADVTADIMKQPVSAAAV